MQQQYKNKQKYNIGDIVYLFASILPGNTSVPHKDLFMCKGVIVKQPNVNNRMYKIIITDVNVNSTWNGFHQTKPQLLLGKKVTRESSVLFNSPTSGILGSIYKDSSWLRAKQHILDKVNHLIKQRKFND